MKFSPKVTWTAVGVVVVFVFALVFFVAPHFKSVQYISKSIEASVSNTSTSAIEATTTPLATHITTPTHVRGIYMSSYTASSKQLREKVIHIAETTEVNTIILDIKDYTGKVSFKLHDPSLVSLNVSEDRIQDLDSLLSELHKKNIYVIGRLAVFQDPFLSQQKPEMAVHRKSDGGVWKDRKGISWIDAGSEAYWKYIVALSKESYSRGFDEINFDYIRYPTDGDMANISYPSSGTRQKHEVIRDFFAFLHQELSPAGIPISADLFGMTTTVNNDLGIGQKFEDALSYMDYVSPMVYPSHYPKTWNGFKVPNEHPYEVIKISMQGAITKLNALKAATSTSAEIKKHLSISELRPWIQDFSLGMHYGTEEVGAQFKAADDIGLDSWLVWNAANHYTVAALKGK